MYIHITFEDRAKPWCKFCSSIEEIEEAKKSWEDKDYILSEVACDPLASMKSFFYTAREKTSKADGEWGIR